jgi:hypothetical protein
MDDIFVHFKLASSSMDHAGSKYSDPSTHLLEICETIFHPEDLCDNFHI